MSMCTPWSMTTPQWPTRKALDSQDGPTCAGFMLRAAHWFATHGYRIDRVMTDNAMAYRRSQTFADAPEPDRRRSQTDPTLPSPDQRQSGTLPPNPPRRMGLQTTLRHQPTTPPSPHQIPPHLQLSTTPQRTTRPTTHHPTCNSPLWEGQLEALSGDRAGQHSIRFNDQWRVCFVMERRQRPPSRDSGTTTKKGGLR